MNSRLYMIIGGCLLAPILALAQASDASKGSSLYSPASPSKAAAPKVAAPKAAAPKVSAPKVSAPKAAASKAASSKRASKKAGKSVSARSKPGAAKGGETVALNGRWQDSKCIPLAGAVPSAARLYVLRRYEFADERKRWSCLLYTSPSPRD